MVGRRNHVVRRLTILVGLALAVGTLTGLPASPAAADNRRCVEYDDNGRCIRWDSGGGVFVEDDVKNFPVPYVQPPEDTFWVYAVTSPCDGGGPPPDGQNYLCPEWKTTCQDPNERLFEIWSQLRKRVPAGNYWAAYGGFQYEGLWCLSKDEGGDQDLIPPASPWTTYVTLLPPGEPENEPSGTTLINLDTNFYTANTETIEYDLILTTHPNDPLDVRATPIAYHWDFGEGEDPLVTEEPGRSYAETDSTDFDVSYQYQEIGTHPVRLRTEYQMAHRPPGQQWSEDAVYTSAPAETANIRVVEAESHHVLGDDVYE